MARRTLNVFLGEELVGQLEQDASGTTRFQYAQAWLDSANVVPLSTSLPLRTERFTRNETRPFFAGVLPEEESRRLIAKTFGVSDKNDFALLTQIGAECAGAVSLLPPGELPVAAQPILTMRVSAWQAPNSVSAQRQTASWQHPKNSRAKNARAPT